ncbi:MAG: NAD(P)-dependent oxidoreductase [Balneolales bacterium]|nr:NAD(P)-dependent oxidoreductase [Balneolales bacterium]
MAEYKRPNTSEEFHENFAQKKPLMNSTEAFYESSRCLFCYDAPCITACPTGIDIPLFIKQIHSGNETGSAKTIFDQNWFGNACGKICPTGVLCEGACVYNHQGVKPIEIGRLQNYATEKVIKAGKPLFKPGEPNGRKVAVIGAGPAGISCACELRTMGYTVDIFEAKDKPSGLTVYGTAPYKITNEEVLAEVEYLQNQLRFRINYNSPITTRKQLDELEEHYDAIFLGMGLGPTATLDLPGVDKKNVIGAVEFIEELRMKQHEVSVPDRVVVIGGGNTAMDAASETARMGAKEVTLAYRRSREEMGGYDFEYDLAKSAGARGLFNVQPVEIVGNGKAEGVRFIRTQKVNGKLEMVEGSEFVLECDMVVKATGQAKLAGFFKLINELELDRGNRIVVDDETFQTTNPAYFAGGDAVNGGAEVVNGAHDGKAAARGIEKWLNSKK